MLLQGLLEEGSFTIRQLSRALRKADRAVRKEWQRRTNQADVKARRQAWLAGEEVAF